MELDATPSPESVPVQVARTLRGRAMLRKFEEPDSPPPPERGRLTSSKDVPVAVVGLGAVGAVAAEELVRRGVPQIVLVDRDLVEARNLERPSIYREADIGEPKATAAKARLQAMNPEVLVEASVKDVHPGTVRPLVKNARVIVDGTDNLATRYVLNEACIGRGIPFIYGAAVDSAGMASFLHPPWTPCFRCLLLPPAAPRPVEPCSTGIARAAPRVADLLAAQALEFLDKGTTAKGLFVLREGEPDLGPLRVSARPGCPACQQRTPEFLTRRTEPSVVQLCGGDTVSVDPGLTGQVSLEDLAATLAHLGHVRLTPYLVSLEVPPHGLSIFPDGRAIIRGVRSPEAAQTLYQRYVRL